MKNEIVKECMNIIENTVFCVQASYWSHSISSKDVREFEEKAYQIIENATIADVEEAYDYLIDCGMNESDVTVNMVLCQIGDKAYTDYEDLVISLVNVIKDK